MSIRTVLCSSLVAATVAGTAAAAAPGDLVAHTNQEFGLGASTVQIVDVHGAPGAPVDAQVEIAGQPRTLLLAPASVRSAKYELLVQGPRGRLLHAAPGEERTLRGSVGEVPGSIVAGALLDTGLYARIQYPDGNVYWMEPIGHRVPEAPPGACVVYRQEDVVAAGGTCGVEAMGALVPPAHDDAKPEALMGMGEGGLCVAEIACDADFEYYQHWGSSVANVEARINLVIDTVNVQYEGEVGITHEITTIIVRTSEPDPYNTTNPDSLLNQFRTQWINNHGGIPRDVAALFTGKNLDGSVIGIAWLSAVCGTLGYNVCQSDFSGSLSCVTDLHAHELGHNWGADHCSCPSNTMNPSVTCANTFSPTETIPQIVAFRDGASCINCVGPLWFTYPGGLPGQVSPVGGDTVDVVVQSGGTNPEPGTGVFYYSIDGNPFVAVPMSEGPPNNYEAIFPSTGCPSVVDYYFSADGTNGSTDLDPPAAPEIVYQAVSANGLVAEFADDFELDMGWTVEDSPTLVDGTWTRGIPVGDGDRGDPPTDADGSGQCYLTDNTDGNSDVDGGATTLISPVMDAASQGAGAIVAYWRWFDNAFAGNPYEDTFEVDVSDDGGATWQNLETVGPAGPEVEGGWYYRQFDITSAGIAVSSQFRIRFTANDFGTGAIVEAGVDGVTLLSADCPAVSNPCPQDCDGSDDGIVGVDDFLAVLAQWGMNGTSCDFIGQPAVGVDEFLDVLAAWGACSP